MRDLGSFVVGDDEGLRWESALQALGKLTPCQRVDRWRHIHCCSVWVIVDDL